MRNDRYLSLLDQIDKESLDPSQADLNDKVLIIDGLNTFIRAFSVVPTLNVNGEHIGGMVGFLNSVKHAIKLHKPTRCIITFDGKGGSQRRRKLYSSYKGNRRSKTNFNRTVDWVQSPHDEKTSMVRQLQRLMQYMECMPISVVHVDNIEADDSIAYITKQILPTSQIVIMSTDKDFLQLVSDRVCVWSPTKKKNYTPDAIKEEYNISPRNFILYRIMDGDKSDNIDGIPRAGLKSIIKYLPIMSDDDEQSIDSIFNYIDSQDNKIKLLSEIKKNRKLLERNFELMQLADVDISGSAKLKINEIISHIPEKTIKYKLQTLIVQDGLSQQVANFDLWTREFLWLDNFVE